MPDCDYFLLCLALSKLSLMLLINYNYYFYERDVHKGVYSCKLDAVLL